MNEPFSEKLRSLADRIEAYAEDKMRVKQAVIDSRMIGGTGIAVVLNNDESQGEEVRRAAGRVASTLGALYQGRISAYTAVTRLRLEAIEVASVGSDKPLSVSDVAILSEMLAMGANADAPQNRSVIIGRLRWATEGKRAFDKLKDFGYVKSAGKLGYYLTKDGENRAKQLS
jgi:hypothetical protein